MLLQFRRKPQEVLFVGAFLLFVQSVCSPNSFIINAAFADSEASSEAASESGAGGGRGRGWWRYQMQQQRMAAQQTRRQQQVQMQQKRRQNSAAAAQRSKPFRVSDYIHEYGSGKAHHFQRSNLSAANNGKALNSLSASQFAAGGAAGNLPATSSVPYQKFPPK